MTNPGNHMGLPLRVNGKKLDGRGDKWYAYVMNPVRVCAFRFSNEEKIYGLILCLSKEGKNGQFEYSLFRVSTA